MKRIVTGASVLLFVLSACHSAMVKLPPPTPPATPARTPDFITGMRQLTFEGARSGEGYFSRDGKSLIFQSEREKDNPFYQEYILDLANGVSHRVSPGYGKTTCGWFHPDGKHVMFSSTHEDPQWKSKADAEFAERKNPKQRYSWNFDDTYDIYQADRDGKHLKNLTHTRGYDAEGSYSPDGAWIAFASNRAAYKGTLSPEDAALFAKDPSYMMEIYIMRADGSEVKRLTQDPGYDGGPFFSPDGKRLVYRHFTPDGSRAEIYSMKVDGSDRRQLTQIGAMSWAPFYHPSGDYIIFASNKFGFSNFELFIVDVDGKHEPVRVTEREGFDGIPVFSPDGQSLVWTHSNEKGEAQLYWANWDDGLARRQLGLKPPAPSMRTLQPAIRAADARQWVEYLASPYFEGRQTGNPHEMEYVQVLADAFKGMGLKSEIQTHEFTNGITLGDGNHLVVNGQPLAVNTDWVPLSYSQSGKFTSAPVVFAGYGLQAQANGEQKPYDSYADLDVKNKWVLIFSGIPQNVGNERRYFLQMGASLQSKALTARRLGARGLLVIDDAESTTAPLKVSFEGRSDVVGLPVLRLSSGLADQLIPRRDLWTKKLADGKIETLILAAPTTAEAEVDLQLHKAQAHNVLALLKVPGATGTVIVGAHLDHLGHGEMGNSLATTRGEIHPGADDNASGVAGVLEVAHALAANSHGLKQNVLFALWTGEEIGILGSSYFANHNKEYKLTASLNMDMIGRYRDQVFVQGMGSATEWKSLIERAGAKEPDLILHTQDDPYLPSDALTFYMKDLPSIMLFTGSHPQYHTPEDKPDLINYESLAKVARLGLQITTQLAANAKAPVTYQKVEGDAKTHPNRGFRLYLGTIPDYARELKTGVAITGTSKDSPAEKAGLQAGDIILELGGLKVGNLYDYVYCLQALKAGEKTKMRILRAGKEQSLEIVPQAKTAQ